MDAATQPSVAGKSPAVGHRIPRRAFVLLGILIAIAGWWYFTQFAVQPPRGIVASGTIESEEVAIAAELAGRVVQLLVDEGDSVRAGDVLVKLDDSLQQLQLRMAPVSERQLLELQIAKLTLRSPLDGIVARRSIRVGEIASPGSTLMVVTKPDPMELTVYVPEAVIGQVSVGQRVEVRVDSFPDEVFEGRVIFIATKAEFTPRNVQTQRDRLNLVFAVKVRIPNPDLRLKPGMPADATIIQD
ncbi:MAG: HlyD family secretion protein [Sphingomonadaceae bacterium]